MKNKKIELEISHLQVQIKELETLIDTHRCFVSPKLDIDDLQIQSSY